MKLYRHLFIIVLFPTVLSAQYEFTGYVDKANWPEEVYLSLIEDYRKLSGIYPEQIIQKTTPDSLGYFIFKGDHLPEGNHIYKIQTHNCYDETKGNVHFNGFCSKSKEILFIASHTDTISLPFSFDQEMFCKVLSTNQRSDAFIQIDSIISEMWYDFGNYRSKTSLKINSAKWLKKLQKFTSQQNEPLLELYVYNFLSNKGNELHDYYLKDLNTNSYYDELLERLQKNYPESSYTNQYKIELASDRFLLEQENNSFKTPWVFIISVFLITSLLFNLFQFFTYRKKRKLSLRSSESKLTSQEQKILDLILADKTNKEIAAAMFVSLSTVKTHINNLYKKLNVSSREQVKLLFVNR